MVGEKKVEAESSTSPTDKNTPKSGRKSRFDLPGRSSKKRASSLPPSSRRGDIEHDASPSRQSLRELPRKDEGEFTNLKSLKSQSTCSNRSLPFPYILLLTYFKMQKLLLYSLQS